MDLQAVQQTMIQCLDVSPISNELRQLLQTVSLSAVSEKNLSLRLALLCCQAAGGTSTRGIFLASAVALTSVAARVLDDVHDGDSDTALWREVGPAIASNAAVALLLATQLVFKHLEENGVAPSLVATIRDTHTLATLAMCSGQHADLLSESEPTITLAAWERMAIAKTAMLTSWSCQAGALLGTPNIGIDAYKTFGHYFGLLYQAINDLQGLYGLHGKTDIIRRKKTLPLVYALSVAPDSAKKQFNNTWQATSWDSEAISELRQVVTQWGARVYIDWLAKIYHRQALTALDYAHGQSTAIEELVRLTGELLLAGEIK